MHMYHFIKIKRGETVSNWYLYPKTESEIIEHWQKYVSPVIKDGMRDIIYNTINDSSKPMTNHYAILIEILSDVYNNGGVNLGIIERGNSEIANVLNNRIKMFHERHRTLLSDSIIETSLLGNDTIVEETTTDTLTFPHEDAYNINDVRYIQWKGGWHWYAKIGKLDICDSSNNYKWATKNEAIEAAKWWINNYY